MSSVPTMTLLLGAVGLQGTSGLAVLLKGRRSRAGRLVAPALLGAGAALGLWAVARCLLAGEVARLDVPWPLPWGRFTLKADALAAVFLAPVFLIPALGALYGRARRDSGAGALEASYGLLAASMAMVVLAQDAVLFLVAWETMALSAYLAATADAEDAEVFKAGWLYLVGAHVGAVALFAMFSLLRRATGSFSLEAAAGAPMAGATASAIFLLGLAAFGLKAGLIPLHLFLPGAPSLSRPHVSAVLSGVVYKVGIYGLIRVAGILPAAPAWWGTLVLFLGAGSAVLGAVFALAQTDLRRALAYSSFENSGIIATGLGLALLGRSLGRADLVVLGLGGALLHAWNHALFKSLLFLCAGAVLRVAGSSRLHLLGGLARFLPRTTTLFVLGAAALCGLPPLNGFVSELLLYLGLFRSVSGGEGSLTALAAPCLATAGALTLACYIGLLGRAFLGQAGPSAPTAAADPPGTMLLPMTALAAVCALLGLAPGWVFPMLDRAVAAWGAAPGPLLSDLLPTGAISAAGAALVLGAGALALVLALALRSRRMDRGGTWDCGFARPEARMAYTSSSFGRTLTGLFRWALWPREHPPRAARLFPKAAQLRVETPDPVLDRLVLPLARAAGRGLARLRLLQQGKLQIYVLYFVVIVLLLFLWGGGAR